MKEADRDILREAIWLFCGAGSGRAWAWADRAQAERDRGVWLGWRWANYL